MAGNARTSSELYVSRINIRFLLKNARKTHDSLIVFFKNIQCRTIPILRHKHKRNPDG